MKIIFFGNGDFGIPTLQSIHDSKNNLIALVTNPQKNKGRGLHRKTSNIYNISTSINIKVFEEQNLTDPLFIETLKALKPDLFIAISYKIMPEELFTIPRHGTINLHGSLLPKYRGAAPIQRALMNGDENIGLTTFYINKRIDCGDILLQKSFTFNEHTTYTSAHEVLSLKAMALVADTLELIQSNATKNKIQITKKATYAKKIDRSEYLINLNYDARLVHNHIRGLTKPGCYCFFTNKRVKLFNTYYDSPDIKTSAVGSFFFKNEYILIKCKTGYLSVKNLQFEGKKIINAKDFNNMNQKGECFRS